MCYRFTNGRGSWLEQERGCQQMGAKMKWPGGASLATIGSSSDQKAVMKAMNGVDPNKYQQVFIGGFNRYYSGKKNWNWMDGTTWRFNNFMKDLVDSGDENCLAFINRPGNGNQRGEWNDVPCNGAALWSAICSVSAK